MAANILMTREKGKEKVEEGIILPAAFTIKREKWCQICKKKTEHKTLAFPSLEYCTECRTVKVA